MSREIYIEPNAALPAKKERIEAELGDPVLQSERNLKNPNNRQTAEDQPQQPQSDVQSGQEQQINLLQGAPEWIFLQKKLKILQKKFDKIPSKTPKE